MGMTSVRMPDDLMSQLEETAEKLQRSKGWVINDAVKDYLAREERKAERLVQTREALDDIEMGRVVNGQEVMNWRERWGRDMETSPPR
jgi:predicted transcriptional regulator